MFQIKKTNDFYRRIKLKAHFKDNISIQHISEDGILKKPSSRSWIRPKHHRTVKTFIEATSNDIDAVIRKPKNDQSILIFLKKKKEKTLDELKARDNIVISNSDKGGAVVILDVKDYLEECQRQLNNTAKNYKRIQQQQIMN